MCHLWDWLKNECTQELTKIMEFVSFTHVK